MGSQIGITSTNQINFANAKDWHVHVSGVEIYGRVKEYATITDMLADDYPGRFAWVIDATEDPTVSNGSALYVLDVAEQCHDLIAWRKLYETECMDRVYQDVTWESIQNKPSLFLTDIDHISNWSIKEAQLDNKYASTIHYHDGRYALIDHNHDATYLTIASAQTSYANINHTHTGFAAVDHVHHVSDIIDLDLTKYIHVSSVASNGVIVASDSKLYTGKSILSTISSAISGITPGSGGAYIGVNPIVISSSDNKNYIRLDFVNSVSDTSRSLAPLATNIISGYGIDKLGIYWANEEQAGVMAVAAGSANTCPLYTSWYPGIGQALYISEATTVLPGVMRIAAGIDEEYTGVALASDVASYVSTKIPTADYLTKTSADSLYAASSHVHTNYLTKATGDVYYASKSHTHTDYLTKTSADSLYAASNHSHDDKYLTITSAADTYLTKTDASTSYAVSGHTHSAYLTKASANTLYASIGHLHTGEYASIDHTHDNYVTYQSGTILYASRIHSHDDYALSKHTHSEYANISHTHDIYLTSAKGDARYSLLGHDHAGIYAPIVHSHTDYLTKTSADSLYAASSHNHGDYYLTSDAANDLYATKTHTHATYADKVHTHETSDITDLDLTSYVTSDRVAEDGTSMAADNKLYTGKSISSAIADAVSGITPGGGGTPAVGIDPIIVTSSDNKTYINISQATSEKLGVVSLAASVADSDYGVPTADAVAFYVSSHMPSVEYLTKTSADTLYATIEHNHDDKYLTEASASNLFSIKEHTHDIYLTKTSADTLYAASDHTHLIYLTITDAQTSYLTKEDASVLYASAVHSHEISNVISLTDSLTSITNRIITVESQVSSGLIIASNMLGVL